LLDRSGDSLLSHRCTSLKMGIAPKLPTVFKNLLASHLAINAADRVSIIYAIFRSIITDLLDRPQSSRRLPEREFYLARLLNFIDRQTQLDDFNRENNIQD
jgi:hypothetical protein